MIQLHSLSPLYKLLAASELLRRLGAYLVGDAAYAAEWFLLTPYKGKSLSPDKDAFNFYQSQVRINIECAFGLLQYRFGIFWRRISITPEMWGPTIEACMKLHNLCLDHLYMHRNDGMSFIPASNPHCYDSVPMFGMGSSTRGGSQRDNATRLRHLEVVQQMNLRRPSSSSHTHCITNINTVTGTYTSDERIHAEIESQLPPSYSVSFVTNADGDLVRK